MEFAQQQKPVQLPQLIVLAAHLTPAALTPTLPIIVPPSVVILDAGTLYVAGQQFVAHQMQGSHAAHAAAHGTALALFALFQLQAIMGKAAAHAEEQ